MRMVLVLAVLSATACGPTEYRAATTAREIGRDRWVIEIRGRRIGPALMLEYQQRKADEVCPDGFTIEQTSGGEETTGYVATSSNAVVPIRRTNAAAVVRCE